ncbi:MAG: aminomethyltransferase [Herpetosiphonaceae bacterium]|nr:MAG: aminomethyltransferase [Herpetosiphonaceae bacterium]
MVEFGGWEMPVQYTSIIEEHHATRNAAGLFDISHMGRFFASGPDAERFLQYVDTYDVSAISVGQSAYGIMCYEDGGVVDDIFVYHLAPDRFMVVVNAGNADKDWEWLQQHARGFNIELENRSVDLAMLALQGPKAETILARLTAADVVNLPFHGIIEATVAGAHGWVSRTGYTGEDGFEIFIPASQIHQVWDAALDAGREDGLKPVGLGARDSLRFEAGLALYGHEIDSDINPYEAKLGWVVKLDKGDFVGAEALRRIKEQGPRRKLIGLEMIGRGIARQGYAVATVEGRTIGAVTSGMPSPTLGKNLAYALVEADAVRVGDEVDVLVREKPVRAQVVKTPFYKPRYKK